MTPTRRTRIEADIARLETAQRALHRAMEEFSHDLRRVGDMRERNGGQAGVFEHRQYQLQRNARLTAEDISRTGTALQALKQELAELRCDDPRPDSS